MSAIVPAAGTTRQLDKQAEPERQLTPDQWTEATTMTRIVMGLLRDVARLKRRFWPDWVEHEDKVFDATGTTVYRLPHGFGGRVRWWVTDWSGATAGARLVRHSTTDDNTLCLVSYTAGTGTVRVEKAG